MYSIIKNPNERTFPLISRRNFMPSTPSSGAQCLHFAYRLEDLQAEIEKRTFYLGKFRRGENGEVPHLLDLIGMSRDEGDLLYSFAKAAMADVFDSVNQYTLHIPKEYVWKKPLSKEPIQVSTKPIVSLPTFTPSTEIVNDAESIVVYANLQDTTSPLIDADKYDISFDIILQLNTEVVSCVNNTKIAKTRVVSHHVDKDSIICTNKTSGEWFVSPQTIFVPMEEQTEFVSSEKITSVISVSIDQSSVKAEERNEKMLHAGDVIIYQNKEYEMIVDTDTNNLNIATDAVLFDKNNTLSDGIHYYMEVPCYINDTAAEPLDNAILEALVNRIIWKWLVLAYPNEAAAYDTIYKDSVNSIRMRCNVLQKNWQKTPRIL